MTTSVAYGGDKTHFGSRVTLNTSVVRAAPTIKFAAKRLHGTVYALTVHLAGWYGLHSVRILDGKHVVAAGNVNAAGVLVVNYQRRAKVTLVASYAGDYYNAPVHASIKIP